MGFFLSLLLLLPSISFSLPWRLIGYFDPTIILASLLTMFQPIDGSSNDDFLAVLVDGSYLGGD
jgi:hypothetical protein